MRAQAQKSAQNSRQRGADVANKNKATYDFQPGDRVYKKRDVFGDDDGLKTASKFEGPFIILERGPNDVYKPANLHTGKILICPNTAALPQPPNFTKFQTLGKARQLDHANGDHLSQKKPTKDLSRPAPAWFIHCRGF